MIDINTLALSLEDKLNEAISQSSVFNNANAEKNIIPNTVFHFIIFQNEGDYKPDEIDQRNPNIVHTYINGVFRLNPGSTNTGFSKSDYVGTASATLEVLVPHADMFDEDGEALFVSEINKLLTETALYNNTTTIVSGDTEYLVSYAFTLPSANQRKIEYGIGDCISFTISVAYGIVAGGLASKDVTVEIYIGAGNPYNDTAVESWDRAYPSNYGLARTSIIDGYVQSNGYGETKCNILGTKFTITLSGAYRNRTIDKAVRDYILSGNLDKIHLRITIKGETNIYRMVLASGEMDGEIPYAISNVYQLVEA